MSNIVEISGLVWMTNMIRLKQDWHVGDQVGSGGFSKVFAAQSESGELSVVKLIPKSHGADREILFGSLKDLSGVPNVMPIIDSGEWGDSLVLVMPKADYSLRDFISKSSGRITVENALQVLRDIAEALAAIEGRVIHRDIKPENLLFWEGQWCLADFGIARYAEATTGDDTWKDWMTAIYAAPERWRNERATSASDVYSLGVVAYELFAGEPPFVGPEKHDYQRQHLQQTPESLLSVPLRIQSLVDECLYKRPEARPTPQNILSRLDQMDQATSAGAELLQQANAVAVKRQAEDDRLKSLTQSKDERRKQLFDDAVRSFKRVADFLDDRIMSNASSTEQSKGNRNRSWTLNDSVLSVGQPKIVGKEAGEVRFPIAFEVVAFADITLRIKPNRSQFEGRSHSLWYCDAQEAGVFRWYETSFMFNPFIPKRGRLDPFALSPGDSAYGAVSPVMDEYQVAWPFIAVDQGDEADFVERWIDWFAQAAQGLLSHPSHMPERDPRDSWRRE